MSDPIREALVAFADFLHRLPDESGYEVGPMKVKFHNGQVIDGPWWVGQNDSRRWVDLFLSDPALAALVQASVQASVPEGWQLVPIKPTPGLLMSMAIRFDHALGIPGYYDQMLFGKKISEFTHEQRLAVTLGQMRQLHEEVVGTGFYAPEREAEYAAPRSTETEIEDVEGKDMAFARRAAGTIYEMNRDLPESDRLAAVYVAGAKHHAEAIGSAETGR